MKAKLYLLVLVALLIASCSKDNESETDPVIPPIEEPDAPVSIEEGLYGYRFVKKEYQDYNGSELGIYQAVTSQREYTFNKGGSGSLDIYLAENTPRGFNYGNKSFSWEITGTSSQSIRISISGGETFTLNNVKITDTQLKSDNEVLEKEIIVDNGIIKKEDILGYSFHSSTALAQEEYGRWCLLYSPATLTVRTKAGVITYITHAYGYQAVYELMPCYQKDNGPLQYWDSDIYAVVYKTDIVASGGRINNRFIEIEASKDKKVFTDNTMYFRIGSFSKDTEKITMIENGKEYELTD